MDDTPIVCLRDLWEWTDELHQEWQPSVLGPDTLWFRGEPEQYSKPCTPSIYRSKKIDGQEKDYPRRAESGIFEAFRNGARVRHAPCPQHDDIAGWLSLMQHYRCPTRLLDWSTSPLVAAYNASLTSRDRPQDPPDEEPDGFIYGLAPLSLYYWLPAFQHDPMAWPTLGVGSLVTPGFPPEETGRLQEPDKTIAELIYGVPYPGIESSEVVALVPAQIDLRMTMQQARFTIHGRGASIQKINDGVGLNQVLAGRAVKGSSKGELLKELERTGISESKLYPELEALGRDLARIYLKPCATHL